MYILKRVHKRDLVTVEQYCGKQHSTLDEITEE